MIKCFICAQEFPSTKVIELKGRHACGDCKVELLQLISEGVNLADRTVAREGKVVVMGRNAELPKRCVKCNREPAEYSLKRQLSYHSPVVYLLLLASPLIYILIAVLVRRTAKVTVPICARHRIKRTHHFFWAWGAVALTAATFIAGIQTGEGWLFATSAILFCVFLGFAIHLSRVVYPVDIDKEYVRLKGVNDAYLQELPDWNSLGN